MQLVVGGTLVNYQLSGASVAPGRLVVVFLHGWGRTMADFDALVHELESLQPNLSFLHIDLPGFGGSPMASPDGFSLVDYADILGALLEKLGIRDTILIGHSFGGRIALAFALRFPERVKKLVLIASAGISRKPIRVKLLTLGRFLFEFLFFGFGNARIIRRLRYLVSSIFSSPDYRAASPPLRKTLKKISAVDLKAAAAKITAPTLLIWGGDDTVTPLADAKTYHRLIKNSHLKVIEGVGHFPFLKKPEECSRLIASFLEHG